MIEEQHVSFDVAKLLKEKGFNERSFGSYNKKGEFQEGWGKWNNTPIYYAAPTQQMAMRWLREDKKILVSIYCHIDKGYWFCIQHFINSPYKFATSKSIHRKEEILGKIQYYPTYEAAAEAATKYCLENLI